MGRPSGERAARTHAQREADAKREKLARINALLGQRVGAENPLPIDVKVLDALDRSSERKPDGRGVGVERAMAIGKAMHTPGVLEALRTRSELGKRDWLPEPPPTLQPAAPRIKGEPAPPKPTRARELATRARPSRPSGSSKMPCDRAAAAVLPRQPWTPRPRAKYRRARCRMRV